MALSIKDEETDRLVRRYARAKGVSYTAAIRLAVSAAIEREEAASFRDHLREAQATAVREPRNAYSADDILGYDEQGLPQ